MNDCMHLQLTWALACIAAKNSGGMASCSFRTRAARFWSASSVSSTRFSAVRSARAFRPTRLASSRRPCSSCSFSSALSLCLATYAADESFELTAGPRSAPSDNEDYNDNCCHCHAQLAMACVDALTIRHFRCILSPCMPGGDNPTACSIAEHSGQSSGAHHLQLKNLYHGILGPDACKRSLHLRCSQMYCVSACTVLKGDLEGP